MVQIALFFVAKRFAIADQELKVARIGLINVRIINFIHDPMTECEPDAATRVIRRANALFRARRPARLNPWRAKRN